MALRPEQKMAQALCDWIIDRKTPPASLLPIVKSLLPKPGGFAPNRNIQNMAASLYYVMKQPGAEAILRDLVYKANWEFFRSAFEGLSVGYAGYQSLAWLAILFCDWAPATLRASAREQLRWDLTAQSVCSTFHGVSVIDCGRIYAVGNAGVTDLNTTYRVRAVRGIQNDGWWPPKGVGPKYWTTTNSVSARPWKANPNLPELLFSLAERQALQSWCVSRAITPVLRDLVAPVCIGQTLHVAAVPQGHVAWMKDLRSYGEGKNTAQPLVYGRADKIEKAVVEDPPTGCVWDGSEFLVNGKPVSGFPVPGFPRIYFGPQGGEHHDMKPLPTPEMSRLGGIARREKLTPERRKEIARMGGIAASGTVLSFCLNGCPVKPKANNLCQRCLQNEYRRKKREAR